MASAEIGVAATMERVPVAEARPRAPGGTLRHAGNPPADGAVRSEGEASDDRPGEARRADAVIDDTVTPIAERRLVQRMLAGDERAFTTFFTDSFAPLYRFAMRRTGGDAEAAEEVVQRTLCAAIDGLDGWRGEARLMTWLCAICRREIAGYYRRRGREPARVELSEDLPEVRAALASLRLGGDGPEAETRRREVVDLVHVALDALPGHYGRALEWKYLEGESMKEIAARLDVTPKAVESLLTRARDALRDALASLLEPRGATAATGGSDERA